MQCDECTKSAERVLTMTACRMRRVIKMSEIYLCARREICCKELMRTIVMC